MIFRKRDWEDEYDPDYARERPSRRRRPRAALAIHALIWGILIALFLAAVGLVAGRAMFDQVATGLATPCGMTWLVLSTGLYFSLVLRAGWASSVCLMAWLLVTVFGNGFIAQQLVHRIESPWIRRTAAEAANQGSVGGEKPLAAVFVLGGGTMTTANGLPELNAAGDRVIKAAQMYLAGEVERIVCTGRQTQRVNRKDLHPADEARRILVSLGVPPTQIDAIEGTNTSTEMAAIATYIRDHETEMSSANINENATAKASRPAYGLITSAWHMSRAMRLADRNNLDLVPIPTDFRTQAPVPSSDWIVPSGESLALSKAVIKEWLAAFLNR